MKKKFQPSMLYLLERNGGGSTYMGQPMALANNLFQQFFSHQSDGAIGH